MTEENKVSNAHTVDESAYKASFDATSEERAALFADDVNIINLDVPASVNTVFGTLSLLRMMREDIVSSLPKLDVGQFDRLGTYAEALSYAHGNWMSASKPPEELPKLVERATALRDQFLKDATSLSSRGFVDAKRLDDLKGGTGYLNLAYDLSALSRMFRERWSDLESKSPIQVSELVEAEKLYEQITKANAERAGQSKKVASAADDRQRAFTLMLDAYEQARRAVTWLRWTENDIDKIVPSLWAGRGRRPSTNDGTPTDTTTPAAPAAPVATPPVAPVVPAGQNGFPGVSPFING